MNPGPLSNSPAPADDAPARRFDQAAGLFLLLLTIFRFWYDGRHELIQDEAYYWQWSRHLDWGFYDNTPLVAAAIRAGTALLGTNAVGVRAEATVSALLISLFLYALARRLLGPKIALVSLVLANLLPEFAGGATLATHDPVQVAFWAAALWVIQRALTDRPRWWYGAGVLAGLAALAKLNALLLLPSVLLYLLLSPAARQRWLRRPEPYVAAAIALLIFSPFVWWNHTHQNAFWIHIGVMGSRSSLHDPPLKWFGRFLGDQALLLSPGVFLCFLYALWDGARPETRRRDDAVLFLWCPSVVVFGATALLSLRSKIEGNWPVAAYVTGVILVAILLVRLWEKRSILGRVCAGLSAGLALLLTLAILFPGLLYGLGVKFRDPGKDRTNEFYGWQTLADRLVQERAAMGGDPFVFGVNYRIPSEAAFYLPGRPQTYSLFLHDRANEYMFWEDPRALVGRDAIFVNDSETPDHLDDVRAVFRHVEPQRPLAIRRDPPYRTPIRTLQIWRCYGFKGYDVRRWQDGW